LFELRVPDVAAAAFRLRIALRQARLEVFDQALLPVFAVDRQRDARAQQIGEAELRRAVLGRLEDAMEPVVLLDPDTRLNSGLSILTVARSCHRQTSRELHCGLHRVALWGRASVSSQRESAYGRRAAPAPENPAQMRPS